MSNVFDTAPGTHWVAVTPSDTADLPNGVPRAIYVGGSGNITMTGVNAPSSASGVAFNGAVAGTILPLKPRRILSTGTTATNIVAIY